MLITCPDVDTLKDQKMPFFETGGKRYLFIHIPKTGGSSIEDWLSKVATMIFFDPYPKRITAVSPQHFPIKDIRRLFGVDWWDWSFTIVRNPYDRLESEYFYQVSLNKKIPEFNRWVEESLDIFRDDPFYLDNHLRTQRYFIDNTVNYFRFEDGLDAVFERLSLVLGVPKPSVPLRSMAGDRQPILWKKKTRALVNDHYFQDFRAFNYPMLEEVV